VENFKAIRDSGTVEFGNVTAFIGNNGVGKSSIVEALETFRDVVIGGIDSAFHKWRGFEHVLNKASQRTATQRPGLRTGQTHPMTFQLDWLKDNRHFEFTQAITQGPKGFSLFIEREEIIHKRKGRNEKWTRSAKGEVSFVGDRGKGTKPEAFELSAYSDGESMLKRFAFETFDQIQFLMLSPEKMGHPLPQQRATKDIRLSKDGSNIAQYLSAIKRLDKRAFENILDAIRFVLPYAENLKPTITSELERSYYLNLTEAKYEVPGWLLSTGTLRVAAILASLKHPSPPSVLVIEEIENGLDPRTLNLIVEEIRNAATTGETQVVLTTHSPYLLNLLDLSHIVIVERDEGQPVFRRPVRSELTGWAEKFSPGKLYTMGRLSGAKK
jgi:predicted ATPase